MGATFLRQYKLCVSYCKQFPIKSQYITLCTPFYWACRLMPSACFDRHVVVSENIQFICTPQKRMTRTDKAFKLNLLLLSTIGASPLRVCVLHHTISLILTIMHFQRPSRSPKPHLPISSFLFTQYFLLAPLFCCTLLSSKGV